MKFQGALIKEQGVAFGIAIVKQYILNNKLEADRAIVSFGSIFSNVPVVLMAQDARGVPSYYGRPDIVKFMANVPLEAVPWKEFSVN